MTVIVIVTVIVLARPLTGGTAGGIAERGNKLMKGRRRQRLHTNLRQEQGRGLQRLALTPDLPLSGAPEGDGAPVQSGCAGPQAGSALTGCGEASVARAPCETHPGACYAGRRGPAVFWRGIL